jgi:ADP-heptose:LPS heptosyltransferase
MKTKRLLIIRLTAMGDVAMSAPVIAALRRGYPKLRIVLLTTPFFRPFFREIPDLEFVEPDLKKRHDGWSGLLRLWWEIWRTYRIDRVADLHDVIRTKILRKYFRLSLTRVKKIHKGRREKRELIRYEDKVFRPLETTVERYADVFRRLGYPVETPRELVPHTCPVPPTIEALTGPKRGKWIGIAPFAQHPGKVYPMEKMKEVLAALSRRDGLRLFIFGGGPAEKAAAEELEKAFPRTLSVVGKIPLTEELDLIAGLDGMVSMDSSAMHMASLMGVPAVTVWGGTHPYAGFLGIGQSPEHVVQVDLPCRPCSIYGNEPCLFGDYRCMHDIDPQRIVAKIDSLIGS